MTVARISPGAETVVWVSNFVDVFFCFFPLIRTDWTDMLLFFLSGEERGERAIEEGSNPILFIRHKILDVLFEMKLEPPGRRVGML